MAGIQRSGRRHHTRFLIRGITVTAFVLLLLFAVLTFLSPPLLDNPSFLADVDTNTNNRIGDQFGRSNAVADAQSFVIPNTTGNFGNDLWQSKHSKNFYGCSNSSIKFLKAATVMHSNRFLMIATSGGLNQQRTGITDAVVAARILNATLIVPKLDQKSFWKDTSNFSEIFDVDWFISSLSKDVKIIKELPSKGRRFASPYTMRVPRKCTPKCYENRVLPILLKKHVVQLTKFDYRLANKLENDLQKLRCRVNYHALKFTNQILEMGDTLIQRMKAKSKHFIALHLRFEPDMLAFSGCYYGGGEKERRELGAIRRRWKTLHAANPDKEQRHGKCPLTPEEVGLMLRALGFGSDVHIYVASGEVYGGEEKLAPLKELFPNFHSKETIASKEELAQFSSFSSRMAALDFIVCDGSDVFVTNNNGNMAKILAGRRRYFGHKRTIRPNSKKLYSLFIYRESMTWKTFATKVRLHQKGFMGEPKEVRPGRGEFHENPSTCICESPEAKVTTNAGSESQTRDPTRKEVENLDRNFSKLIYVHSEDEDPEWPDTDDVVYESSERESSNATKIDYEWPDSDDAGYAASEREPMNTTDMDYDMFMRSEEPELVEMLSD